MRRTLVIATILTAALLAVTSAGGVNGAAQASPGADTFLGYEVGEERRYAIAPDNALRDGENVTWSIRLDRVEAADGRAIGVFELGHVESRWGIGLSGTMLVEWHYRGEARINEYGFPEQVRFEMREEHVGESDWRGEPRMVDYTLDGDEFLKTVRGAGEDWQFTFGIATDSNLDLDVPTGMYLFRPQAAGIDFFMNPGLLGLAIPEIVPDNWEQRAMFFRPTYPVRYPGEQYARFERDKTEAIRRYYVKRTLEAKETTELEIGDRTLNVRRIDVSGAMRSAWIDEFGRVVRVDLDPDPITRRSRHIRLLFPSEY